MKTEVRLGEFESRSVQIRDVVEITVEVCYQEKPCTLKVFFFFNYGISIHGNKEDDSCTFYLHCFVNINPLFDMILRDQID
jgi:hypothetical protein